MLGNGIINRSLDIVKQFKDIEQRWEGVVRRYPFKVGYGFIPTMGRNTAILPPHSAISRKYGCT